MRHGFEAPSRDDRAMTAAALAEAAARLSLLERYVREDPVNLALLADACETAIAAGLHTLEVTLLGAFVCGAWRLLAMWRHWQAPMPQGPASV